MQSLLFRAYSVVALAVLSLPIGKADPYGTLIFNDWVNSKAIPSVTSTGGLTTSSSPIFWQFGGGCSGGSFEYCAEDLELRFGAGYTFEKVVWMTDNGPVTWQPLTATTQTYYTRDPGTNLASDSLGITPTLSTGGSSRVLFLAFRSYDPNRPACASVNGCALTEAPDSQQVIAEVFAVNGSGTELQTNIAIVSDATPEPLAILLLGTVLVIVIAFGRRSFVRKAVV